MWGPVNAPSGESTRGCVHMGVHIPTHRNITTFSSHPWRVSGSGYEQATLCQTRVLLKRGELAKSILVFHQQRQDHLQTTAVQPLSIRQNQTRHMLICRYRRTRNVGETSNTTIHRHQRRQSFRDSLLHSTITCRKLGLRAGLCASSSEGIRTAGHQAARRLLALRDDRSLLLLQDSVGQISAIFAGYVWPLSFTLARNRTRQQQD